jgi:hypothetical protein
LMMELTLKSFGRDHSSLAVHLKNILLKYLLQNT